MKQVSWQNLSEEFPTETVQLVLKSQSRLLGTGFILIGTIHTAFTSDGKEIYFTPRFQEAQLISNPEIYEWIYLEDLFYMDCMSVEDDEEENE